MKPTFPLIVLYDGVLDLIPLEENLKQTTILSVLQGTSKYKLFDGENNVWSYKINAANIKNNFFTKFLANTIYNPTVSVIPIFKFEKKYEFSDLKILINIAVDKDNNILTQFIEASQMKNLIDNTNNFIELYNVIWKNVYNYEEKTG